MPITIDIKQDARYQQGVMDSAIEIARRLFQMGMEFSKIQNFTGLDKAKLEEIQRTISDEKP